ncbi:MAG: hypothetical protein ABSG52_12000 [Terriglobales bacterium]|jgi:hypothetical protein
MSKQNVKEKDNRTIAGWDAAIADAKQRIQDFRKAIRVYTEAKRRGESWPTAASTRN